MNTIRESGRFVKRRGGIFVPRKRRGPVILLAAGLGPLDVPAWAAAPFALLLALIAVLPLVAGHWWHPNKNKLIVSGAVGLPVAIFLLTQPNGSGHLWHSVEEYLSFIVLL